MPVESSAAARRVVGVLTCLASSDRELTLTEIALATDTNKTTCQSVLLALVDSGYVRRDEARKTYRLGPAVLALTTSVGVHHDALARVRLAMEAITGDLDVETTATVVTDREIVKVAQVPRPRLAGHALRPGQTVAFAQPLGAAHVAWSDPATIGDWLARGGATARSAAGKRALGDLALVRARGFSATTRRRHRPDTAYRDDEHPDSQVRDIGRSARRIRQLAVPIFGPDRRVLLVMGALQHDEADAATIRTQLERLRAAADQITVAIGGANPSGASRGTAPPATTSRGMPQLSVGRTVTAADVRSPDDDA